MGGGWGLDGKGEGNKKYKLVVTEQSRGCKVQQREHSNSVITSVVSGGCYAYGVITA